MATWHRQQFDEAGQIAEKSTQQVVWVAAGLTSVANALADGNFPVAYNDAHPDFPAFRANNIRINARGFQVFSVTADYEVPSNGDSHPEEDDLTKPAVFSYQTVQESVAIDRDATDANNGLGNPIVSSAGRSIQGINRTKNYKRLTITKWLASYDVDRAFEFENTVNSAPYENAKIGEVKCAIIQPNTSFPLPVTQIGIDHVFDFKPEEIWGKEPWQLMVRDEDSVGYADGKIRRFTTAEREPLDNEPLDGTGRPKNTSVTYVEGDAAVLEPVWEAQPTPAGATILELGVLTYLRYQTLPLKNFNSLNL
jgi:hypothetical protein